MDTLTENYLNGIDESEWQKCRKCEMVVVVASRQAEIIETLEVPVGCGVGDAIITGVRGGRWPVRWELFEKLYEPIHMLQMGEDGWYHTLPYEVDATRMICPFRIELPGQQGALSGKVDEWLVRKQDGSLGIVAGDIFSETYDLVK